MAEVNTQNMLNDDQSLLVINCGSSSLKAAYFASDKARQNYHYRIDPNLPVIEGFESAFKQFFAELGAARPTRIAHRFVFGGHIEDTARLLTVEEQGRLETLVSFAPLHLPLNLLGVRLCASHYSGNPRLSQWACFDNGFHYNLPALSYRYAIPESAQLRRFGFHGLNYAHIAKQLPGLLDHTITQGRIVVAHLGSGCSVCLLENLQSVDTSMGYSTAGGIPMATRSGDLDPGVMLALAKQLNSGQLEDLIFHQSGLHALSNGESSDMQTLLDSDSPAARFAVDYFARSLRAMIGSYAAKAGGIDALVFTGGIGEHASKIRALICDPLSFLGFRLSPNANQTHQPWISDPSSKPILVIPADEEAEMAAQVTPKN
ncbi:acetate kinase [Methylophilus sp.]|jgi:acetate kinase|uniref:acetate/propionate family kinase n=1 Tax=Methylophilus sp. TaxID=29541 RepID=UPI000D4FB30B|nr:acetate kinase [Methylophilus sp.]PPD13397.1 MAG: acetate kinase [Methylophilus sp.]